MRRGLQARSKGLMRCTEPPSFYKRRKNKLKQRIMKKKSKFSSKNTKDCNRDLTSPYDRISKAITRDRNLSSDSKILLIVLLNNSSEWIINITKAAEFAGLADCRKKKAIKELRKYGYLTTIKNGMNYHHIINECPNSDVYKTTTSTESLSGKGKKKSIVENTSKTSKSIDVQETYRSEDSLNIKVSEGNHPENISKTDNSTDIHVFDTSETTMLIRINEKEEINKNNGKKGLNNINNISTCYNDINNNNYNTDEKIHNTNPLEEDGSFPSSHIFIAETDLGKINEEEMEREDESYYKYLELNIDKYNFPQNDELDYEYYSTQNSVSQNETYEPEYFGPTTMANIPSPIIYNELEEDSVDLFDEEGKSPSTHIFKTENELGKAFDEEYNSWFKLCINQSNSDDDKQKNSVGLNYMQSRFKSGSESSSTPDIEISSEGKEYCANECMGNINSTPPVIDDDYPDEMLLADYYANPPNDWSEAISNDSEGNEQYSIHYNPTQNSVTQNLIHGQEYSGPTAMAGALSPANINNNASNINVNIQSPYTNGINSNKQQIHHDSTHNYIRFHPNQSVNKNADKLLEAITEEFFSILNLAKKTPDYYWRKFEKRIKAITNDFIHFGRLYCIDGSTCPISLELAPFAYSSCIEDLKKDIESFIQQNYETTIRLVMEFKVACAQRGINTNHYFVNEKIQEIYRKGMTYDKDWIDADVKKTIDKIQSQKSKT